MQQNRKEFSYLGIKRRFEVILNTDKVVLIDDYVHHPEEISVAIAAARRHFPKNYLVTVFQPHLFSRTRDFAQGFSQALTQSDEVLLTHIYPAREQPIEGVSCEIIYDQIERPIQKRVVSLNQLSEALLSSLNPPTTILVLGAGDISQIIPDLKSKLLSQFDN